MRILKRTSQPSKTAKGPFPVGSFVRTEAGAFYLHSSTRRYRIISDRVLDSWSPQRVIESDEESLKSYSIVAKLKFRNGSFIWSLQDGKLYLIEQGKRRHVISPRILEELGIDVTHRFPKGTYVVSPQELSLHPLGDDYS